MSTTGPKRFTGRVAVVTGAASGIGAATARRLAIEGSAVVLTDVDDAVDKVALEIESTGATATAIVADASSETDWARVVERARRYGDVGVLVSNAFTVDVAPAGELDPSSWDYQLRVNLTASYLGFRACLPGLSASRGSVVLVSSVHALLGIAGHPAYAAAKGGLVALTRQLAVEYAPDIRVNCVLPGPVLTGAWDRVNEIDRQRSIAATPAGRMGDPGEVAAAIAFLASAEASFVTGSSLVVDGGWSVVKDSA
jgi:NAD(P)-dependent dehydrogenase (short-subunit alcohol dehydrogenase family)